MELTQGTFQGEFRFNDVAASDYNIIVRYY